MTVRETMFHRLGKETRGGTDFIELLILVAVIAIAGAAAFKPLAAAISSKASQKADEVNQLP
jgi:hypothetical protein